MNRRAFFRLIGRASGTAAAVLVGGAALLPKVTGAVQLKRVGRRNDDGSIITFVQHDDGKLFEISHEGNWREWHAKAMSGPMWTI